MTEARGSWVRAVSSLGWLAEIAGEQLGRLLMEGAMQMDGLLRAEGRVPGHACKSREQVAGEKLAWASQAVWSGPARGLPGCGVLGCMVNRLVTV